jgi:hypothetical protein
MGHQDSSGNWVRNGGESVYLRLPISYATADAEVLFTVPTAMTIAIQPYCMWEVTTAWTGGSSSAIGISSSLSPHDTAGDIHGGASGDVLATLVVGYKVGTQGASFTAAPKCVVLTAGATIKFNRITSAFTAGAGYIHLPAVVVG